MCVLVSYNLGEKKNYTEGGNPNLNFKILLRRLQKKDLCKITHYFCVV